jgi:hypothetical protein
MTEDELHPKISRRLTPTPCCPRGRRPSNDCSFLIGMFMSVGRKRQEIVIFGGAELPSY